MTIPLEIAFRDVPKTEEIENLIRDKFEKLERLCGSMMSRRVAVGRPQGRRRRGDPYEVRISVRLPPGHEIVVSQTSREEDLPAPLPKIVRRAFSALERRLKDATAKRRGDVKHHPEQVANAVVIRLHRDDGYGFLRSIEGHEVYFHRNAVSDGSFEELREGASVRYVERSGEEGPQASSVHVVHNMGSPARSG